MKVQNEAAVVGGEEEVLATPASACEPPLLERCERWVERLQRGDVSRACRLDHGSAHPLVEGTPKSLNLGELGYLRSFP